MATSIRSTIPYLNFVLLLEQQLANLYESTALVYWAALDIGCRRLACAASAYIGELCDTKVHGDPNEVKPTHCSHYWVPSVHQ